MRTVQHSIAISIFCFCIGLASTAAQTNEFTYQGKLTDTGTPLATYDFEFRLCASDTACTTPLETKQRLGVSVTSGIFTVKLDFNEAHFTGADRFLEIMVRRTSADPWTTLDPRQKISSAPYALKSLNAGNAENSLRLGGQLANQFVLTDDARLSDARMPTAGSADYIQNNPPMQQATSSFNISGTGTANIFHAGTRFDINGNRVLSNEGANNLFVGRGTGNVGANNALFGSDAGSTSTPFSGANSFFGSGSGFLNGDGSNNAFFGTSAGGNNSGPVANANTFIGSSSGTGNTTGRLNTLLGFSANMPAGSGLINATAIGGRAFVTQDNSVVLGSINGVNGATADTDVGIGTTAPSQRLHVVGSGLFTGNLTVNGTLNANLPTGSGSYIQNSPPMPQNGSFDISGNGTAGGTLRGNAVTATTQFNVGSDARILAGTIENLLTGIGAGTSNSGTQNTFVGAFAGNRNETGNNNSYFGYLSGRGQSFSTGGSFNSFFGHRAGEDNAGGNFNSFFGHRTGENNSGDVNSFFGTGAGLFNNNGSSNTFLGHDAGNNNVSGSFNTVLGENADLGSGDLTNATAIGSRAQASLNNSLVLGSINGTNGCAPPNCDSVNVGIGTTAPQSKLHVNGNNEILSTGPGAGIKFRDRGSTSPSNDWNWYSSGNVARFWRAGLGDIIGVTTAGNVGIGNNNPQERLNVNGNVALLLAPGGDINVCQNSGNFRLATCGSSIRYKLNVNSFNSGLDLINRLRPVTFNWKADNKADMGLIAEEVAEVEPLLATYNEKGEVEGVKYDRLGVVLINAVREQQAQIEAQKKWIEQQQRKIDRLTQLVCATNPSASICNEEEK